MTRDHRVRWARDAATTIILAVSLAGAALTAARPVAAQSGVGDLPLSVTPAAPGPLLAVLLTGDGGWAAGDKSMAKALAERGIAVVGLNSARYLERAPTPDAAASDLERIVRHFLETWQRERVVLIGYSRGADLVPFMLSRLPADLRNKVVLAALLGPGEWASFEFNPLDIAGARAAGRVSRTAGGGQAQRHSRPLPVRVERSRRDLPVARRRRSRARGGTSRRSSDRRGGRAWAGGHDRRRTAETELMTLMVWPIGVPPRARTVRVQPDT